MSITKNLLFFACPICQGEETLIAKVISGEGSFCGFCTDCLDICERVGRGDTDSEAILNYIESNLGD